MNAYPFVWCSSHPGRNVSPGENFGVAAGAPGKGIRSICGHFSTDAGYVVRRKETRRICSYGITSLGVDYVCEYIAILLIK